MWTINDFPAYDYMSGWSIKGKLACPIYASETCSRRLRHGSKTCYMGHRRFLPSDHSWRKNRKDFDNTIEKRGTPRRPSGDEVVNELQGLREIIHGKKEKKQVIPGFGNTHNWNKHSIFFRLPYWKILLLSYNLDVMHIEKNILDNVVGTMMNIDGKIKDFFECSS